MVYVLNTAVLTDYGEWVFEGPITAERARALILNGFVSAVGHQGAADYLTNLLGVQIRVNRVQVKLKIGDQALVVRALQRLAEGSVLTAEEMGGLPFELGILTRRA
jgi:F0F1-type ATP synthase delta subunit